jgi:hypothetical protein
MRAAYWRAGASHVASAQVTTARDWYPCKHVHVWRACAVRSRARVLALPRRADLRRLRAEGVGPNRRPVRVCGWSRGGEIGQRRAGKSAEGAVPTTLPERRELERLARLRRNLSPRRASPKDQWSVHR